MNNINKSVICIVLVIIFIAVFIGLRNSFAEKTNTVEIIQDGKIIYTLDLNKNKDELKSEIHKSFEKYISEFDAIPESLKDTSVEEVDRTPAENLAYQVGWTTLVLKWEEDERKGLQAKTPSNEFKWNQLGDLYQWFNDTYAHLSLREPKRVLVNKNLKIVTALMDNR